MMYMSNSIFSCQTTLSKAKYLEVGIKSTNLASLVSDGNQGVNCSSHEKLPSHDLKDTVAQ